MKYPISRFHRVGAMGGVGALILAGSLVSDARLYSQEGGQDAGKKVEAHAHPAGDRKADPHLFRGASPESVRIVTDPRLKDQQIRYAPIGDVAIIEGDIVLGKLADIRKQKLYHWAEEASKHDPDDRDLLLTDAQRDLLRQLRTIRRTPEFQKASKQREQTAVKRLLADVVNFEKQAGNDPDYPTQAIAALKKQPGVGGGPAMMSAIVGPQYRWPNGVIPYTIDSNVPDQQLIRQAIDHWHSKTDRIHLTPRQPGTQGHENYVRFVLWDGCSSAVGRQGGEQLITLAAGCLEPQIIHEIGHAVGLWHEQSRNDRNDFLEIHDENVDPEMLYNFDIVGIAGQDIGQFDFASIMLYPPWAFTATGQATMVSRFPGIGDRWGVGSPYVTGLSSLDVQGLAFIYPKPANPPNPRHAQGVQFAAAALAQPPQRTRIPKLPSQRMVLAPAAPPTPPATQNGPADAAKTKDSAAPKDQ